MHTKASKRFNVRIAMVQGVNILVQGLDVNEPLKKKQNLFLHNALK